jgi:hypothetical protein
LQLFYRDGVDQDILKAERARIEAERTQARRCVASATREASEALEALDEALALVENAHSIYLASEPEQRRLLNQAIFSQLRLRTDLLEGEEAPIFSQIRGLSCSCPIARTNQPNNNQDPLNNGGLGSNLIQLVRMRGLEPPRSHLHTDLNRARLPIPPHPPARPDSIASSARRLIRSRQHALDGALGSPGAGVAGPALLASDLRKRAAIV